MVIKFIGTAIAAEAVFGLVLGFCVAVITFILQVFIKRFLYLFIVLMYSLQVYNRICRIKHRNSYAKKQSHYQENSICCAESNCSDKSEHLKYLKGISHKTILTIYNPKNQNNLLLAPVTLYPILPLKFSFGIRLSLIIFVR